MSSARCVAFYRTGISTVHYKHEDMVVNEVVIIDTLSIILISSVAIATSLPVESTSLEVMFMARKHAMCESMGIALRPKHLAVWYKMTMPPICSPYLLSLH